jgi:hypothetical protein
MKQDEELFLYYGKDYLRNYPFNPSTNANQFSHYIPTESTFVPDPRGVPAPLILPDLVYGCITVQRRVEKGETIERNNSISL